MTNGPPKQDATDTPDLRLITDRAGEVKVFVPGHLYKPSVLAANKTPPEDASKTAGPGGLIDTESDFLADWVKYLDPELAENEAVRRRALAPIGHGPRKYFLLRNIDRAKSAARFRLGESNWFYPDFIFWIVDEGTTPTTQRLCYLDPKGLASDARGGWSHYKILCFLYKLVELQRQFPDAQLENGPRVKLHFRGAFLSTSSYVDLRQATTDSQVFHVYDENLNKVFPTREQFARAGIFFKEQPSYPERLMEYLMAEDSLLSTVMDQVAAAHQLPGDTPPTTEIGCFFRSLLAREKNMEQALAEVVRYSLTAATAEEVIARMRRTSNK
jgi:hypothetical protein